MEPTKDERIMRMLFHIHGMSKRLPRPPEGEEPPHPHCPPSCPPFHGHGMGRVLSTLNDNGDTCQASLARELDIRPQSLSEVLVRLEEDGCITRQPSPTDKRQTIVGITEQGRTRVAEFRKRHRERAKAFLAPLTEEEKDDLARLLDKLIEANKTENNRD